MAVLMMQEYSLMVIQCLYCFLYSINSLSVQVSNQIQILNVWLCCQKEHIPFAYFCLSPFIPFLKESVNGISPTTTSKTFRNGKDTLFPVRKHSSLCISFKKSFCTIRSSLAMQSQFSSFFLKTQTWPYSSKRAISTGKQRLWIQVGAISDPSIPIPPIQIITVDPIITQYPPFPFHFPLCFDLQYLMNSAQLEAQNFDLSLYLQALCKKQQFYEEGNEEKPEMDFISLEKDLLRIQGIQERTCEQIVEFVDQHRQRFVEINDQLDLISDKVSRSEAILKLLGSQIDDYRSGCYLNESKIQRFITDYELRRMQDQLLATARTEALFLIKFNSQFENITSKQIVSLNLTQKYLISRFTFKSQYLISLYNHQIVQEYVPETLQILQIITNMSEELEFYLSEQLAKYQSLLAQAKEQQERAKIVGVLGQIKAWYMNIGKREEYYRVLEKNTIEKEMQAGEKLLLANKSTLLSGKDQQVIENVFYRIFAALTQFPEDYPKERLRSILFTFFKKEELKFLYTYAMPIFPLSYTSYLFALESAGVQEWLKTQLKESHGWNLKMWVMVRQKNILDRSNNDPDLLKWIDIIFKQACMLPGTLTEFLKLAFKLVNRYLDKLSKAQFTPAAFNRLVEQHQKVGEIVAQKVVENTKDGSQFAKKVEASLKKSLQQAIKELLNRSLQNVAVTCQNFLEPVKSFVSKIIKKDKDFVLSNTVNKHENLFKPLHSFIKNNAELSPEALQFITHSVEAIIIKHYDSKYAPEIYTYSKDQLISEQVSLVMEVVGRERTTLFKQADE